jgi:hypothetical protein
MTILTDLGVNVVLLSCVRTSCTQVELLCEQQFAAGCGDDSGVSVGFGDGVPRLGSALGRASIAGGRRLVEHYPEQTQLSDGLNELLNVDWLDDVSVDPQLVALDHVSLFR